MAYSGKFQPKNPQKYKGNIKNIIWRSTWERKFMKYCDLQENILEWSSEEMIIPYRSLDKRFHRYFVDFWIKVKDKNGEIYEKLIEIKPSKQCKPPAKQKKMTKQHAKKIQTFIINTRKWEAARKFAKKRGMEFLILTEKELGIKL